MEGRVKVTRDFLKQGMSRNGGWSNAQFRALGVISFRRGWRKKLKGKYVTEARAKEFIRLKDEHLIKKDGKEYTLQKKQTKEKREPKSVYQQDDWVNVREKVLERDGRRCVNCGSSKNLQVHHLLYERGKEVWAVPIWYLVTLCENCHKIEHTKDFISPSRIFELKKKAN